jgi:hypothetical protein
MEIDGVAQGGRSGASIGKDKDDLSIGRGDLPPVLAGVLGWSEEGGCENKRKKQANPQKRHSFSGSNGITKVPLLPIEHSWPLPGRK